MGVGQAPIHHDWNPCKKEKSGHIQKHLQHNVMKQEIRGMVPQGKEHQRLSVNHEKLEETHEHSSSQPSEITNPASVLATRILRQCFCCSSHPVYGTFFMATVAI